MMRFYLSPSSPCLLTRSSTVYTFSFVKWLFKSHLYFAPHFSPTVKFTLKWDPFALCARGYTLLRKEHFVPWVAVWNSGATSVLNEDKRNRRERVSDFKWSSLSRGIFNARHRKPNICSPPFPAIQPQNECYTECNYADYLVLEKEQLPNVKGSRRRRGLPRCFALIGGKKIRWKKVAVCKNFAFHWPRPW